MSEFVTIEEARVIENTGDCSHGSDPFSRKIQPLSSMSLKTLLRLVVMSIMRFPMEFWIQDPETTKLEAKHRVHCDANEKYLVGTRYILYTNSLETV